MGTHGLPMTDNPWHPGAGVSFRLACPVRTVILRHTLPDGSWHHDWLIERPGLALVPTWRTGRDRPDDPALPSFDALRIGEHRAHYLSHEGEVPGGRGSVVRVAEGVVMDSEWGPGSLALAALFGDRPFRFVGRAVEGDRWRFLTLHG